MLSILLISSCLGTVPKALLVYFDETCSESRICCVKIFEICVRHVCEKSGEIIGSEVLLGWGGRDVRFHFP